MDPDPPGELSIAAVAPDPVTPQEGLELTLSHPVSTPPEVPVRVRSSGAGGWVAHRVGWVGPDRLRVEPDPVWPVGVLQLSLLDGFAGPEGRPLVAAGSASVRVSAPPREPPVAFLRAPAPGSAAPSNLAAVVVGVRPPEAASEVEVVTLSDGQSELTFRAAARALGAVRATGAPACPPLCPGAAITVRVEGGAAADGSASFRVGPTPDHRAPRRTGPPEVATHAAGVDLAFSVDEPGWVELWAPDAPEAQIAGFVFGRDRIEGRVSGLPSRVPVELRPRVYDLAGNGRDLPGQVVERPRVPEIRFSEVVASPLRDWGDSEPAGVPFDARPGSGSVSDADEWVELVHHADRPVDLRRLGVEIEAVDGSPSVTPLLGAPALHFGAGGRPSEWMPREGLVVRLRGSLSSQDLTLRLMSGGLELDRVVLGDDGDHPGGSPPDAVHGSIARDVRGRWRWCAPSPGDGLPAGACIDG